MIPRNKNLIFRNSPSLSELIKITTKKKNKHRMILKINKKKLKVKTGDIR